MEIKERIILTVASLLKESKWSNNKSRLTFLLVIFIIYYTSKNNGIGFRKPKKKTEMIPIPSRHGSLVFLLSSSLWGCMKQEMCSNRCSYLTVSIAKPLSAFCSMLSTMRKLKCCTPLYYITLRVSEGIYFGEKSDKNIRYCLLVLANKFVYCTHCEYIQSPGNLVRRLI